MKIQTFEGIAALPHAADCARIHTAAFAEAGARGWSMQEFDDLFRRPGSILFRSGHAFLLAQGLGDQSEILTFAVAPDYQRRGIGKALIEEFIAHSTAHGAHSCILEVAVSNLTAVSLYQLVGFQTIARRKDYFLENGGRTDALIMQRSLG